MAEETTAADSTNSVRDFSEPWDESDVSFLVEDKKLHANKAILSMWSPVFKAMFSGDFKEKKLDEIPLPGKKYNDVVQLLGATHPPMTNITDENVETVLQLSREYQISQMINMSESHLVTRPPSVRNLIIAREYGLASLEKMCKEYAENTAWDKLKEENDLDGLIQDVCAEVFKERIEKLELVVTFARQGEVTAKQEEYMSKLKEINGIAIIKERDCTHCQNSLCVDCDADTTSGARNCTCEKKGGKWPYICRSCTCKRFNKIHDLLLKLDI